MIDLRCLSILEHVHLGWIHSSSSSTWRWCESPIPSEQAIKFFRYTSGTGAGGLFYEPPGVLSNEAHWGLRGVCPDHSDGPSPSAPLGRYTYTGHSLLNLNNVGEEPVPLSTVMSAAVWAWRRAESFQSCKKDHAKLIEELRVLMAHPGGQCASLVG